MKPDESKQSFQLIKLYFSCVEELSMGKNWRIVAPT